LAATVDQQEARHGLGVAAVKATRRTSLSTSSPAVVPMSVRRRSRATLDLGTLGFVFLVDLHVDLATRAPAPALLEELRRAEDEALGRSPRRLEAGQHALLPGEDGAHVAVRRCQRWARGSSVHAVDPDHHLDAAAPAVLQADGVAPATSGAVSP